MADLIYWALCLLGTILCVYSLYLNDWDLEKTFFRHTSEDDEA